MKQPQNNLWYNFRKDPFCSWLLSRQDIPLKLLFIFATSSLLISGGLSIREIYNNHIRNTSYSVAVKETKKQNYLKVVEASEQFLIHKPIKGKDQRGQEIKKLYAKGLIQWSSQQGEELDSNLQTHIKTYQNLTKNL
jgi:hypothetical protein